MKGLQIDFETADRITVCVMKDQLAYLLRDQEWFEAGESGRKSVEEKYGRFMWVHPDDYVLNAEKYIPALRTLIEYFDG